MKVFEFDSVRYFYPDRTAPALENLSFSIEEGEFVLLLGPSGSGKSTAARVMGGLIPKFYGGRLYGNVLYRGRSIAECRDFREQVGMVFQNPDRQILAHQVENELALGMENLGFSDHAMKQRMNWVLECLGIESLRHRKTYELSGGEKQRVILGAILAMGASTLVLDEPTSQLDPAAAEAFLCTLKKLHRDLGFTIILIEHRTSRSYALADRVLFFEEGRLVSDATTLEFADIAKGSQIHYLPIAFRNCRPDGTKEYASSKGEVHCDGMGILCRNVSFSYAANVALFTDVNAEITPGCVTAIVGENGAGKSTLLKLFAGLLQPFSGEIRVGGKTVYSILPHERMRLIGYLPQQPDDFLFNDTVEDELHFTLHGASCSDQGKVEKVLRLFSLEDLRNAHPKTLSVGEKERVALASVWIAEPRVLLLDEPTRGTEPDRRSFWAAMFKRFTSVPSRMVVFASQDMEFVAECANRVIVVKEGALQVASSRKSNVADKAPFASELISV